jgi:hypothetical protein
MVLLSAGWAGSLTSGTSNRSDHPWQKLWILKGHNYVFNFLLCGWKRKFFVREYIQILLKILIFRPILQFCRLLNSTARGGGTILPSHSSLPPPYYRLILTFIIINMNFVSEKVLRDELSLGKQRQCGAELSYTWDDCTHKPFCTELCYSNISAYFKMPSNKISPASLSA